MGLSGYLAYRADKYGRVRVLSPFAVNAGFTERTASSLVAA